MFHFHAICNPFDIITHLHTHFMPTCHKMSPYPSLHLFICTSLILATLQNGFGEKCDDSAPTVQQTKVGLGNPPKFKVQVHNTCPMCPIINVHLKCGSFPQPLVDPKLLKVLAYDDCVINSGLPLAPLQNFSFSYSHQKYLMQPGKWYFQCE